MFSTLARIFGFENQGSKASTDTAAPALTAAALVPDAPIPETPELSDAEIRARQRESAPEKTGPFEPNMVCPGSMMKDGVQVPGIWAIEPDLVDDDGNVILRGRREFNEGPGSFYIPGMGTVDIW